MLPMHQLSAAVQRQRECGHVGRLDAVPSRCWHRLALAKLVPTGYESTYTTSRGHSVEVSCASFVGDPVEPLCVVRYCHLSPLRVVDLAHCCTALTLISVLCFSSASATAGANSSGPSAAVHMCENRRQLCCTAELGAEVKCVLAPGRATLPQCQRGGSRT